MLKYCVLYYSIEPMSTTTTKLKKLRTLAEYLSVLRSPKTVQSYREGIRYVTGGDPDGFLQSALRDKQAAEDRLIEFIVKERGRVQPATIVNPVIALRSFTQYNEVSFNWERVTRALPAAKKVADDRAPEIGEVRRLMEVCDIRIKAVVLMLFSSGLRVGGFWYPKPDRRFECMRVKDLFVTWGGRDEEVPLATWLASPTDPDGAFARLRVYRDTPDVYSTFISTEAFAALRTYLDARARIGERLNGDSPLIRNDWGWDVVWRATQNRFSQVKYDPERAKLVDAKSIQNSIGEMWLRSGVRSRNHRKRQEFQQVHGFRKYFETECLRVVGTPIEYDAMANRVLEADIYALKGKKANYNKPAKYLKLVYLALMPRLLVGEGWQLKVQAEDSEKKHESEWTRTRLELLEEKEKRRELEEKVQQMWPLMEELKKRVLGSPPSPP